MDIKEMRSVIAHAQLEMNNAKKLFKEWCKDQSIPLDARWKFFVEMKLGDTSDRTTFGLNRDDKFLFESPCYMERYNTRDVEDILESLTESDTFAMKPEEVIVFKNYCLDNFYSRMTFDW